jgi:SAM-dependent methyltransferase
MAPASFEAILIASDVYAHVPGRAGRVAALARVREALRPGGVVWVAAYASSERWVKRLAADVPRRLLRPLSAHRVAEPGDRFSRSPSAPWPRYHHRFACDAEIEREIAEAGFVNVERVEGFFVGRTPTASRAEPRYRTRSDVHVGETKDDLILVQLSHGHACALNPTARQIWDLAVTGLSVAEIAQRLHQQTGATEARIAQDARELLETLAAGALLDRVVTLDA